MFWTTEVEYTRNSEGYGVQEIILKRKKNGFDCIKCFSIPSFVNLYKSRIIILENGYENTEKLKERYNMMKEKDISLIENIKNEIEDDYSDDSLFNISSWGADLSFREIISMYEEDELIKPELQRKYVWDKAEASRFIESILMGLPVPSVFFAQSGSRKLIVDGYQRIMTVYDYVRGIFAADGKIFRLSNSDKINERWRNKAFSELTLDEQRKIRSTTIHAIVFEQKKPENDDTSLYQVFERINTSGRTLTPQEIRNCVYQGTFNTLLFELNENEKWRKLFGLAVPDSRMRDIECILRFFVMKSEKVQKSSSKQISLKKALNEYMGDYSTTDTDTINDFRCAFIETIEKIYDVIGVNAFRNYSSGKFTKKFHPAIFDAISIAFFDYINEGGILEKISEEKHISLLENEEFKTVISTRTTDIEHIKKRIQLAKTFLLEDINNEA